MLRAIVREMPIREIRQPSTRTGPLPSSAPRSPCPIRRASPSTTSKRACIRSQAPVTLAEKISEKDVYEANMAFTRRCRALGSDFERERNQSVKRCDFLRDKIVLTGFSQVKSGDGTTFKLILKPAKKPFLVSFSVNPFSSASWGYFG
ncbi:hypothetical protein SCHPADRAFT_903586 [Schizopora paradoxa]|uniref:DUF6699 domain-containing protein n=1 Tax=Schizopora paradoxa TaxID=27342 RepID=A0A0H2RXF5_9AGAM|nr:hypothetical protein SCHPADRAFT_903586 [Schizopora paradoxa]